MRVTVFSSKPYDVESLQAANAGRHEFVFLDGHLDADSARSAEGSAAVCVFVNDLLSAHVLETLHAGGVRLVALRCAGYNHVDLARAAELGISVRRVPAYSPYAVAEFTLALILTLNRKTHRAYNRVREGNFSIDGLLGFDLHGSTVGIVGTGKIGQLTANALVGLGCRLLGYDPFPHDDFAAIGSYVDLPTLLAESDIISLHCPLTPKSHHLINADTLRTMRRGVMLINTSRGALIDAIAVTEALKSGQIGYLGIDVYEQEADLFHEDLSGEVIQDDVLQRLIMFPNVLVTSHQAFFTDTAIRNIAETTVANITDFEVGARARNEVKVAP